MKIKYAALDLDDTTLRSDSTLADETYEALTDAARAGMEIIVASGRAFTSLPKKILDIEGVNYAISSNGSAVNMAKTGERIMSRTIDPGCAKMILDAFPDSILECFIDGQPYCGEAYFADPLKYGCSPAYVSYVRSTRKTVPDIRRHILDNIDRLDSIDIICPTPEIKSAAYSRAKELRGVYVTSSSPRLVEFGSADAGKGSALRWLCAEKGMDPGQLAAFGNGDNDADMLLFAGFGVAVANATEYCKACADCICCSNDELGVAKTLRMLLGE